MVGFYCFKWGLEVDCGFGFEVGGKIGRRFGWNWAKLSGFDFKWIQGIYNKYREIDFLLEGFLLWGYWGISRGLFWYMGIFVEIYEYMDIFSYLVIEEYCYVFIWELNGLLLFFLYGFITISRNVLIIGWVSLFEKKGIQL